MPATYPAFRIARRKHGRVHCACRSAGDAVDFKPWFFEKPVEDAPGESAVRSAALKREINQKWIAIYAHQAEPMIFITKSRRDLFVGEAMHVCFNRGRARS
jgi:hypothetical protein